MHAAAAACDDETAAGFCAFLYSLTHVLPCPECRAHLYDYVRAHPPDEHIKDAQTASRYCFDLHNYVNVQTGKASQPPRILYNMYKVRLEDLDQGAASSTQVSSYAASRRSQRYRRRSFHIL